MNGRSFDLDTDGHGQPDMLVLADDLWRELVGSEDLKRMLAELETSYAWDRLIEVVADDLLADRVFDMHSKAVTKNELALVTMALEPRMNRVVLAEAFLEFLQKPELKSAARVVRSPTGCAYVFTVGSSMERKGRFQELALRCLVVRGRMPDTHTVVGIATDRPGTSTIGYSIDMSYVHMPAWTEEQETAVQTIQRELGYFDDANWGKR